jgi:hypothetical protein
LEIAEAFEQHLPGTGENREREILRQGSAALALRFRHRGLLQHIGRQLAAGQPMGEVEQILEHDDGIGAGLVHPAQLAECFGRLARHHRFVELEELGAVGDAEHRADLLLGHFLAGLAECDRLVEQRKAVARRSVRGTGDQSERIRGELRAFRRGDVAQMLRQLVGLDAAEVEALASRKHRHRHLANLGRGEDELHMLRRLFQGLQQCVEGAR